MVLQSSIVEVDVDDGVLTRAYTVTAEIDNRRHRILTVTTSNDEIASKWIKHVQKNLPGYNIVGICLSTSDAQKDDVIQICVATHCLIYKLSKNCGKFLDKFFGDYFLKTVGFDMADVAKRLKENYGIIVKNPIDLRKLATERREDLCHYNLYKFGLDRLACAVLGKKFDMDRPQKKKKMMLNDLFVDSCLSLSENVKFATIDPFICLLIGDELISVKDWQ